MIRIFFLAVIITFSLANAAWAQETKKAKTDTTDTFSDYSEYSWLWDDPKAKAKAEKKRLKEAKKKQKLLDKQKKQGKSGKVNPTDSLKISPADSLKTKVPVADSLKTSATAAEALQQLNEIPTDTIPDPQPDPDPEPTDPDPDPEPEDPAPKPQPEPLDTLKAPEVVLDSANIAEEPPAEVIEKKERKDNDDGKNIQDFRAGLAGVQTASTLRGGFSYTNIGGQNFVGLTLNPELNLGKVGVGLNIPILYGLDDQSLRTDIFEDGIGVGRLITYVRYGTQKKDPVYVRLGELNNTMIGFGGLVNNYSNSISYEKRKVGLHFDFNVKGLAGLEGMYSDFDASSLNLLVLRPYVRPLAKSGIPIARTFELGATFIRDKDQTKRATSDSTFVKNTFTEPGIGAFGIDAGVTLLRIPFIQIDLFANYGRLNVESPVLTDSLTSIFNTTGEPSQLSDGFANGSGFSFGFNFRMHFILDVFSTDVRIERLSYTEHYLPQFFDTSYEINKDGKILSLANAGKQSGIYGSLTGHVLEKVRLGGSLLIPDDVSEESPALVQVNADVERLADKISLHGSYFKGGLSNLSDAFKLDERSIAKLRFVYHLNKYLAAGLDYYWAFARTEDGSFKSTRFISPYFGLNIEF